MPLFAQVPLLAQVPPFGASFPAANTRYGSANGEPLLRTNGRDAFLFWTTGKSVLGTRLVPGEQHVSRPVLELPGGSVDVAWAGDHFVAVATVPDPGASTRIEGRVLDRNGNATGESFPIVLSATEPRLAYNGSVLLLVYRRGTAYEAVPLDPFGRVAGESRTIGDWSGGGSPRLAASRTRFLATLPASNALHVVTFDSNGTPAGEAQFDVRSAIPAPVASDGDRFLIAARQPGAKMNALLVDANGTLIRSRQVGTGALAVDTIWTGSQWMLLWMEDDALKIAEANAEATFFQLHDGVSAATVGSMTFANGRKFVAWKGASAIYASPLPLTGPAAVQSFAANNQRLLATAASADATLAVWNENGVRIGIRKRDGSWRELAMTANAINVIAASDGRDFAVIHDRTLMFFSPDGIPLRSAIPLSYVATAIAWNGRDYLLYTDKGMALVSPSGVLSPPVPASPTPFAYGCSSMASDGDGFLALCYLPPPVLILVSPPGGVAALRFDAAGHLLETIVLRTGLTGPVLGGVAWTGRQYVAAWRENSSQVVAARIGSSTLQTQTVAPNGRGFVSVVPARGGAYLGWSDTQLKSNIAFLGDDGQLTTRRIDTETATPDYSRLHVLADGTLVRLFSAPSFSAPHYGQSHVSAQIGAFSLPAAPDAPLLTVRREGAIARLQWTEPPQTASSYRIEYAVNDGIWLALEDWLASDRRTLTFPLEWSDATYSFRVRALNDAGPSGYSYPVSLTPSKRRSAR